MFVLVLAVPALLVVVLGYAVGYGTASLVGAHGHGPEVAGWLTGLLLLVLTTWLAIRMWRRRG